jgi:hypothetical protein
MSYFMSVPISISENDVAEGMAQDDEFAVAVISCFLMQVDPQQIAGMMAEEDVYGLVSFADQLKRAYETAEDAA